MNIDFKLKECREKLEQIEGSLEHYQQYKAKLLSDIQRIESMANNGEIGLDEYDAMMRSHTDGLSLPELEKRFDVALAHYSKQKEHALEEMRLYEMMVPEKHEESSLPYIFFISAVLCISAGLFAAIRLEHTGLTIFSDTTSPDQILSYTIIMAISFIVMPILGLAIFKIWEIFKKNP
ncbi:MAG: hypothetical protein KKE20_02975 [Nanoarchaeota archaeon]|nr:hypothetical protein [Nanoarchaeota archaeon]